MHFIKPQSYYWANFIYEFNFSVSIMSKFVVNTEKNYQLLVIRRLYFPFKNYRGSKRYLFIFAK